MFDVAAYTTIKSLYSGSVEYSLCPPSTGDTYTSQIRKLDCNHYTVVTAPMSTALTLPEAMLRLSWLSPEQPIPGPVSNFWENSIADACIDGYRCIAQDIQKHMFRDVPGEPTFKVSSNRELAPGRKHRVDVALEFNQKFFAFKEAKTLFSALHDCWNKSPFACAATTEVASFVKPEVISFVKLDLIPRRILEQARRSTDINSLCCTLTSLKLLFYADKINVNKHSQMLVALVVPPVRLHFIVIDLKEKRITVFENVIKHERRSLQLVVLFAFDTSSLTAATSPPVTEIERVRHHSAWKTYFKTVAWFNFVALKFHFKEDVDKAIQFDSTKESPSLEPDLRGNLEVAVALLGEVAPLSLWARFTLRRIRLMHFLTTIFVDIISMLWVILSWQTLRADSLLRIAPYLKIPRAGTLDLRNE